MNDQSFVDSEIMADGGPILLRRTVARLLIHIGFDEVADVDGSYDQGADLIAFRGPEIWVVQVKWKLNGPVPKSAVHEVRAAWVTYGAHYGLLVTNSSFARDAVRDIKALNEQGCRLIGWDGDTLRALFDKKAVVQLPVRDLRPYQQTALLGVKKSLSEHRRALVYMATGLGKTTVIGSVTQDHLKNKPSGHVLILAHMNDIVYQIEQAVWPWLTKYQHIYVFNGSERPSSAQGVVVASLQSINSLLDTGFVPTLIVVDEAHHVSGTGGYAKLFDAHQHVDRLGVTATPWRGDGYDITHTFGPPVASVSIEDGMNLGYLSHVRYQVSCDNVDWEFVQKQSRHGYSIKELNRKLFLPGRDAVILDDLLQVWRNTKQPKGIIFCQSILHAEYFLEQLLRYEDWASSSVIHSGVPKWKRSKRLIDFKQGSSPILVAVDVLNEGIDVPDVNIVCFLRVTHSRRIFVQQLGRGLRIAPEKDGVTVLDFVSDIRRMSSILELSASLKGNNERLDIPKSQFTFSSSRAERFFEEWLKDAASLSSADDEAVLNFPPSNLLNN